MHPPLLAGLVLFPLALAGQGWIAPDRQAPLLLESPQVARVSSAVRVVIDGRVARVEVEERFRNTGGRIAEGSYQYPLPGEAVFSDFSLFQGDQELKGEMMNAAQARGIYEEIVRRQRDPALITLAGHGLIRAQVFPIQPGETRTVILRYTQLLAGDQGALHFRHAAGTRGDAPVTLRVEVPRGRDVTTPYSPTHALATAREGGALRITVTPPVKGDVELVLPLRTGLAGGTVLTFPEGVEALRRPFRERYRLRPFGHGFMHVALATGVPIVPAAVIGAEEEAPLLANPRWLARLLATPVAPLTPTVVVPLPVKYRIHFGSPLRLRGPATPDVVARHVATVRGALQALMERGLAARRHVFF